MLASWEECTRPGRQRPVPGRGRSRLPGCAEVRTLAGELATRPGTTPNPFVPPSLPQSNLEALARSAAGGGRSNIDPRVPEGRLAEAA
jgi:hypothetical protein